MLDNVSKLIAKLKKHPSFYNCRYDDAVNILEALKDHSHRMAGGAFYTNENAAWLALGRAVYKLGLMPQVATSHARELRKLLDGSYVKNLKLTEALTKLCNESLALCERWEAKDRDGKHLSDGRRLAYAECAAELRANLNL